MTIIHAAGEALDQNLCRAVSLGSWERVAQPVTGGHALRTYQFGQPLILICGPETDALIFLRHAWSGTVAVTVDGDRKTIALSAEDGLEQVSVTLPRQSGSFEVTIESVPVEGRDITRGEIWLLAFAFHIPPLALGRAIRINDGTKLVRGDWGDFLALSGDTLLPDEIARSGSWAPDDIKVFQQHIGPGDLVLDVGANIGHHSVVFAKIVGASGLVIAVEAQRVLHQLVHANALLNRCHNIVPIHAAAGAAVGSVMMHPLNYEGAANYGALGINALGVEYEIDGETVPTLPLDAVVRQHAPGRRARFVKIDVQAYELYVLQGMTDILSVDRPAIFIEISPYWMREAGYDFRQIYALLRDHGYDLIHREGLPLGSGGYPEIPEDSQFEWDILAIHPEQPERET